MDPNERNIRLIKNKDYNTLVEENQKLVYSVINNYRHCGVEYEELIQIGLLALYKAALNFDNTNTDAKFSTYAAIAIRNNILNVIYLRNKKAIDTISYNQEIRDRASGDSSEILSYISDSKNMEYDIYREEFKQEVINIIESMERKNYTTIGIEYFINEKSCQEIAEQLNSSRQNVSRVVNVIKEILQKKLRKKGINEYYF